MSSASGNRRMSEVQAELQAEIQPEIQARFERPSPGEHAPKLTEAQARGLAAVVEGSVYRFIPTGNRPMRWIGAHSVLVRRMIATGLVDLGEPAPTGRQAVLITNLGRRALQNHRADEILADLDQDGSATRR